MATVLLICIGASMGALLRWKLGELLNSIFPAIPMGTLTVNLLGGFLMGIFLAVAAAKKILPEAQFFIVTGFLGGLTTFSTFSGELFYLFSHEAYLFSLLMLGAHVIGSLVALAAGLYLTRLVLF